MPERKPYGPTQHPEWQPGDPFDPSALNTVFGSQAVEVATWVYDDINDSHGYHWSIARHGHKEKGVNSIDFFPSTGLLIVNGTRLKNPTVLQGTRIPTIDIVAYSISKITAESSDNHGTATFTTHSTNKHGERVRINSTGAVTILPPERRVGGSMRTSIPQFYTNRPDSDYLSDEIYP